MKEGIARFRGFVGAVILAWACGLPSALAAPGDLTLASDLVSDAAQARTRGVPLLILFSLPDCQYCDRVRRDYLLPLQGPRAGALPAILRQVDLGSARPLKDFAGASTTHDAFARRNGITLAPTIKIYDGEGHEAAEPLVGLLTPDLFGAYLEHALEKGHARMTPGAGKPKAY